MRQRATRATAVAHPGGLLPFPKFMQSLLAKPGRVSAYYGESWDEILDYNAAQIAAGTPEGCVAFEDSAGTVPLLAPLGAGKGVGLLKDRSGGGNHRIQTSATARGEMSRLVNMLVNSNALEDPATWSTTATGAGVLPVISATTEIGPSGKFARRVDFNCGDISNVANRSNLTSGGQGVGGLPTGAELAIRFRVKAATPADVGKQVAMQMVPSSGLNVVTLTADWQEFEGVRTKSTTAAAYVLFATRGTQTNSPDVSVLFDGVDIRPTADRGVGKFIQRVTSPADYDEEGFPAYLRRQTDDWSKTHINPAGASKVFALTAVQKMSDAALGILIEHTTTISNDGSFYLAAPVTNGVDNYGAAYRQSTAQFIVATAHAAPKRAVLGVRTPDASVPGGVFVNGSLAVPFSPAAGLTAFVEGDTHFGGRAGTSFFVNDREYSPPLIIFMQPSDPGLSASEIARLTRQFNQSIKAF